MQNRPNPKRKSIRKINSGLSFSLAKLNPFQRKTKNSKSGSKSGSKIFYYGSKKPEDIAEIKSQIRVFKPSEDTKIKNVLKRKSNPKDKPKNYLFGFKNFSSEDKLFASFRELTLENFWKQIKIFLFQLDIKRRLNKLVIFGLILSIILFVFYLAAFDRFFLVNNYRVIFAENSFLAPKEIQQLAVAFNTQKIAGVVPNNQFWFVNDFNLTAIAKKEIPEVNSVKIIDRIWPNTLVIQIRTDPILLTLGVYERNQKKYWRVAQNGRIFTEDSAYLFDKLVFVETPINLVANDQTGEILTLQDYALENSETQLNRLWFIIWLWQQLGPDGEGYDIKIIDTRLPSLVDTDVIMQTRSGVDLYFDSNINQVPRESLRNRLRAVFRSQFREEVLDGKIRYLDFRLQNKKIIVCYAKAECDPGV